MDEVGFRPRWDQYRWEGLREQRSMRQPDEESDSLGIFEHVAQHAPLTSTQKGREVKCSCETPIGKGQDADGGVFNAQAQGQ